MKRCPACGTEYPDDASFCTNDRTALHPFDREGDTEQLGGLDPMVGRTLADRYRIVDVLGAGGMGRVYLAEHILMKRRCAIKVLHQALSADPAAVTRFNHEAANAARINHPNVCAVYDFGSTEDGLMFLAMEYVDGRTLSEELRSGTPLALTRAAALNSDCCDALQAAHELGIVHRDLKPDNIMLVQGRDRETVKLVDFGIAKAVGGDTGGQSVTKTGFIIGTPEYMSPEQLSGDPVDPRSDIYSAALVFYRMVTGVLPFASGTAQETLVKRLTERPLSLEQALPDAYFPPDLEQVVSRALARWPKKRYATAEEFGRAITEVTGRRLHDLAELPTVAADATRVAMPDVLPPTEVAREQGVGSRKRRVNTPLILATVGVVAIASATGYALRVRSTEGSAGESGDRSTTATIDSIPASVPVVGDDSTAGSAAAPPTSAVGRPDGHAVRDAGTDKGVVVPPAGGGGLGDTEKPAALVSSPDLGSVNETIVALQDSIFDAPAGRTSYRLQASRIFEQRTLPDSLRSRAALTVAAAYIADSAFREAREWSVRAYDLIPESDEERRSRVKAQIDQLARARD
ncbi:MAG: protein kinase [Gemmatimonadales bacterium]|nr:protein kinase [Gemmatimonadales bacterium]